MPDTEKLVTLSRLKTLLDAYGAAPGFWPEEERAAARALIGTSSEARILMEEAAALDSLLDKFPEPEVSAALTSRVRSMGIPAIERQADGLFARLTNFLRPQTPRAWQGAVAMAGMLGMVAGIGLSQMVLDRTETTPRIIAITSPVTSNVVEANTASLAPNVNALSLTGDDVAETRNYIFGETANNTEAELQSDVSEFTIASVPLY